MIRPLWPHPAALIKTTQRRILVIADLHIGWEMAVSGKGIHLPTQTPKILGNLKDLISRYKPEELLILGDVKHTVASAEMAEWHDVPDFFNELRELVPKIRVIRGNHDGNLEPLLPENIELFPGTGMILGKVGFFHGHQWPSADILTCKTMVMGHVHPVVSLRDPAGFRITRQVWIKAACDRKKLTKTLIQKHKLQRTKLTEAQHHEVGREFLQLFIMPSFNEFLGGRPLNERRLGTDAKAKGAVGPIFHSEAVDMEKAETYLLDGSFLGTLGQLRMLS
jgi:putative SbcD/Mre11-related phosphoesterase